MKAFFARSLALAVLLVASLSAPALADFQFTKNIFMKNTVVGPQAVTGVGFQPKAVIFFYTRQTATGVALSINGGWGFTTGPSNERAIGIAAIDNQTSSTADSGRAQSLSDCIVIVTTGALETIVARAELTSFDADGFTLNWTTNEARADIIHFIALGGSDITDAVAASFQPSAGTGIEPVPVGFQPDFVMMLSNRFGSAGTITEAHHSIGFATRTPFARAAVGVQLEDDDIIRDTWVWQRTDSVFVSLNDSGTGDTQYDIAFTPTGFDINKIANAFSGTQYVHYLALKGGRYGVGSFAKNNAAAAPPNLDQAVAGVGFQPVGVVLASDNLAANAAVQPQGRISFGASDLSKVGATWWHDRDGVNPTDSNMRTSTSEIAVHASGVGGATVDASGYLKSFDSSGFTLTWTANNTGAGANHEILYAAFGPSTNYRSIGTRANYGTTGPEGAGTTVTAVLGSRLVTGAGTTWKTSNRGRGDRINIQGVNYTVYRVLSQTQLELTTPFGGTTGAGKTYTIARQFSTLAAWEDCIDGPPGVGCPFFGVATNNLVTDNRSEVGVAYRETALSSVTIDGSVTDAAHTITLTADDGNRHYGIAGGGVAVDNGGNTNPAIRVLDNHVTVEWLEVRGGAGASADAIEVNGLAVTNRLFVRNLLLHNTPGNGVEILDGDTIADVYNNIVYEARVGILVNAALTGGSQLRIFNNTVYSCNLVWPQATGIVGDSGLGPFPTVTLVNNIAHSNVSSGPDLDFGVPGRNGASSDNLSSDSSATPHSPAGGGIDSAGSPDALFKTITFGSEDLHLEPSGAAVNQGVDLSSLFTEDIDGRPRVALWDIGADDAAASASANLTIAKTDGQTSDVPGTGISYTITVTNLGPDTITSLNVTDPVPPAILTPVFTPSVGSYNSVTGRWTGLTLFTGQSAVLTLSGTISSSATGTLTNTATVAPAGGVVDPDSSNNTDVDDDTVLTPQADLQILKSGPGTAVLGETIVYSVTARNNGPSDASGVVVEDTLPPEVVFLSSAPAGPLCTYDAGLRKLTCNVGPLVAGGSFPVLISVRVAYRGSIVNAATVSPPDSVPANNAANAITDVVEEPCSTWWNGSWGRRLKLTFNNSGQAENLLNFPVLIVLTPARIDYTQVQGAGQDLRFVDANDSTLLNHEIERWTPGGTSYVWVQVPKIDASSSTDFIYMYYGNAIAPDGQNVAGTWDTNFKMVHHLNETSPGPHTDSTSNGNDSSTIFVAQQGTAVGQIDGADRFDIASSHYVRVPDDPTLDAGAGESLTVEAWVRQTDITGWQHVVSKEPDGSNTQGGFEFAIIDGVASFAVGDTVPAIDETCRADSTTTLFAGPWYYLVGRYDRSTGNCEVFVNGVSENVANNGAIGSLANPQPLGLGREEDGTPSYEYDGRMDEVRLSKTARSNDWIRAQNLSMRDPLFVTYGGGAACHLRSIGTRPNYGTAEPEGGGSTVRATTGLTTVDGTGTAWRSANRGRGDRINIEGTNYTIASVTSETLLTLTVPFAGATGSGKSYWIARKFQTLTDWESCIDGIAPPPLALCEGGVSDSLVADNRGEVGVAYDDTGYPGYPFAGMLVIDGRPDNQNTNATHTITLTADGSNRHYGLPGTGVVVDNTAGTSAAAEIRDNFVTVEWLEIRSGAGAVDGIAVDGISPANRVVIANDLIHGVPGGDGIELRDTDLIADVYNNVIYGNSGIGVNIIPLSVSGGIRLLNNTVYNNTLGGIRGDGAGSYANVLLRNNIAVGNAGDFSVTGRDPASSHNLGSDGSGVSHSQGATGVNSSVPLVNFVDTASGNLHLKGPSTAENAGANLSSLFTGDIDAGTRTAAAWDIGADEFEVPAADLGVTKTDGQTSEIPGTSVVYTITVTNYGPDPVTSLFVVDTLPSDLQSPMFTPSVGTYNSGTGLWTGLTLAATQSATLTLTGTIDPTATGSLTNRATVAPPGGFVDPNSVNDWWEDVDTLTPPADLQALKTGPGAAVLGGTIVYSVTARNNGPASSTGGTLVDTLPPEVEFVSSAPAGPDCNYSAASHRLTCNLPPLAASGTYLVSITVRVVSPGSIVNVASVSGPDPDIPGNNIATATTDVPVPSDEVQFFTVTSRKGENVLEWLYPAVNYNTVRIVFNSGLTSCTYPLDPMGGDGTILLPPPPPGSVDGHDSYLHAGLTDTNEYCYTIFVDIGGGNYSVGRSNRGRPFDTSCASCYTKWAFSVGSTSLAPPGIGVDAVHAVANDNALHAMRKAGRADEGTWPSSWRPKGMLNGPSQGRPTTINIPTGFATRVVFLGSQNGNVYAIDADAGGPGHVWAAPLATLWAPGTQVQATPSGVFAGFGGSRDYVLVGTRLMNQDNAFYALNRATGTPVAPWPFTGTGPTDKIGMINFQASVDYANHRVYFTSFVRGGGFGSNTVWCLDFWTMGVIWARAYTNVTTSPTLVGNRLYVGTATGEVLALRADNGELDWMVATADGPVKGFVMVERVSGDVYFATTTKVHARRMDGSFKWERPLSSPSTPVILAGRSRIYVGTGDGLLHGLKEIDGNDEAPFFPIQMGDGTAGVGSVTIDTREGHLYVGTEAGIIYAVQIP